MVCSQGANDHEERWTYSDDYVRSKKFFYSIFGLELLGAVCFHAEPSLEVSQTN